VTEFIDRLKVSTTTLFGLPPSLADLDAEEQKILRYAGLVAVAVLWFTVALVELWLLLALPLAAGGCAWLIRKRRAERAERGSDEPDDWSY
jgi:Flp pilus assembly protein TadB